MQYTGLTDAQAAASIKKHGSNALPTPEKQSFLSRWGESFSDPMVRILLAALGINAILLLRGSSLFETVGIALSILLSTLVSTISEYSSEAAFEQMQKQAGAITATAVRNGAPVTLPAAELAVGDIVLLQAGEYIPADGRLLRGSLQVDQSSLTGESREVGKHPSPAPFQSDINHYGSLFYGSTVTDGEGVMQVCAVGAGTHIGALAGNLGADTTPSPLKQKLEDLAIKVSRIGYLAAALVVGADLFHSVVMDNSFDPVSVLATVKNLPLMLSHLLHALTLGVTLVVVAVPEGLPMMITVVLSRNMVKMQRDHVMVRRPVGLETAGSMDLLFTDKTGTLTTGKTRVQCILLPDGQQLTAIDPTTHKDLCFALRGCPSPSGGNSTDKALASFAPKGQCFPPVTDKQRFDSANKFSWVKIGQEYFIKGAPEILLPFCKTALCGQFDPQKAQQLASERSQNGFRVVALCKSKSRPQNGSLGPLTLLGFACLSDSLRHGIPAAVQQMHTAGAQVVMITGDSLPTAAYFAQKSKILQGPAVFPAVTEAKKLRALSDKELADLLPDLRVVARAVPQDKLRLVKVSKAAGHCVGMTGDGLNDAPALKAADVGFAMGSGTAVSRQAGDIILLDDNFVSITRAVLYGRTVARSIKKFITFQLCLNLCAAGVSLVGPFVGVEAPITVVQMLWINLLMDTFAGLAFAGEPALQRYMRRPPEGRSTPVLTSFMLRQVLWRGGLLLLFCLCFLGLPVFYLPRGQNSGVHLGSFFALFVYCGILLAFGVRTSCINPLKNLGQNMTFVLIMGGAALVQTALSLWGGTLFRSGTLSPCDLGKIALLSMLILPADMLIKLILNATKKTRK